MKNLIWHVRNNKEQKQIARRLYEYSIEVSEGEGMLPFHRGLYVKPELAPKAVNIIERDFGRRY